MFLKSKVSYNRIFHSYNKVSLSLLKDFFKESIIFVVFWLLNGLIPVLICLICASINKYGSYFVLGIGYITAFQLAYVQIGWVISIAVLFLLKKMCEKNPLYNADFKKLYFNAFITITVIAFGLVPLFLAPTYAYNHFANNHVNTIISQVIAEQYIYGLLIYIFVNVIISFLIINIHINKGLKISLPLLVGSNLIIVGVCALLSLLIKYNSVETNALMIGMSISIGSVIALIIIFVISLFFGDVRDIFQKFDWLTFKIMFKSIIKQAMSILSIQIIKGIVLIGLGIAISATMNVTAPMGYQLSRVVWYNYLYLIPFLAYGLGDAMLFYGMRKNITASYKNIQTNILILIIFALLAEVAIAIGLYFTVEPLSSFYVKYKEIDWSYINLNSIDLPYTIQFIAQKLKWSETQINWFLKLIQICENHPLLGKPILNIIERGIVYLLSNNNMTGSGVSSYLLLGHKAYIYISIFSVGYSCAILVNNINLSSKGRYSNIYETLFLIILQAIVISSVVAMGVRLQSTSSTFPYLDSWSFPLALAGGCAFIMFVGLYIINVKKIKNKDKKQNNIFKLNEWNHTKNEVIISL